MKKSVIVLALIVTPFSAGFLAGSFSSGSLAAKYENTTLGFRMQVPSPSENANGMVAMFATDASEDFAPNLNVATQPSMSPAEYSKQTLSQFEKAGITLIHEEKKKVGNAESITWEYSGKMRGRELHFLARAIFLPKQVLLATCSGTPKQFDGLRDTFKATLDSIELTADKK